MPGYVDATPRGPTWPKKIGKTEEVHVLKSLMFSLAGLRLFLEHESSWRRYKELFFVKKKKTQNFSWTFLEFFGQKPGSGSGSGTKRKPEPGYRTLMWMESVVWDIFVRLNNYLFLSSSDKTQATFMPAPRHFLNLLKEHALLSTTRRSDRKQNLPKQQKSWQIFITKPKRKR